MDTLGSEALPSGPRYCEPEDEQLDALMWAFENDDPDELEARFDPSMYHPTGP